MSDTSTDIARSGESSNRARWVRRLTLTTYRNYDAAEISGQPGLNVLVGPNGSGKTNILEALSLLAPGQGLRRSPYEELARRPGEGGWTIATELSVGDTMVRVGTGQPASAPGNRTGRLVSIDGERCGPTALAELLEVLWVTPAMDGLFTGPGSDRRRVLDRLILCFDASLGSYASRFEKAMRNRNRLLYDGIMDDRQLHGLEIQMAETGVAIAAARIEAVAALRATIAARRARDPTSPFPWSEIAVEGRLEHALIDQPAIDVEDNYVRHLRTARERDRAAGRTLQGPHRTDIGVTHGPKDIAARSCSTGEQKALLLGLVLAHAELLATRSGTAPVLLLDEISAHLDMLRREALFAELERLGGQAWMTGTDIEAFAPLRGGAAFHAVAEGHVLQLA